MPLKLYYSFKDWFPLPEFTAHAKNAPEFTRPVNSGSGNRALQCYGAIIISIIIIIVIIVDIIIVKVRW